MNNIIISRHPAAIEFIRRNAQEFATAPVLESAAPEDVRGKIVAGNLPLHLAAIAAQVVAVEFSGPPPRGTEYTAEDMEAAGARIRRYTVAAVTEPPEDRMVKFSATRQHRGLYDRLILGGPGEIREFSGAHVPGLVAVRQHHTDSRGKWSRDEYELVLAPGTWSLILSQDWDSGRRFHGCATWAEVVQRIRAAGCTATDAEIVRFVRDKFPNESSDIDASDSALASVGC